MRAVLTRSEEVANNGIVCNRRGQATTELLLVSVWFFVVVLVVIELTVTMAGGEAASYISYMSARAETAGASGGAMAHKLTGAIPWAGQVEAKPDIKNPFRMTVKVPSPLVVETVGHKTLQYVMDIFSIEAGAEMPDCCYDSSTGYNHCTGESNRHGDNDLF